MLRTDVLHPEARFHKYTVVVFNPVVDSSVQGHIGDIGDGEIVVSGARKPLRRAFSQARTSDDVVREVRRFSRKVQEEVNILQGIIVKEDVYPVVGGVATSGNLQAESCFEVNFLVGVIQVEVAHSCDEILEYRSVPEVNLHAGLTVTTFRQSVESGIHGLEHSTATAERGRAICYLVSAINRQPLVRHYANIDRGFYGRTVFMATAERALILRGAAVWSYCRSTQDIVERVRPCRVQRAMSCIDHARRKREVALCLVTVAG